MFTKAKPRPQRDRSAEFASFTPKPRESVMAAALHLAEPIAVTPKTPDRKSHAIRQSANGEQCLVRLPGCIGSAIWSHNRHGRAGKGGGIKALDLNGCYCCTVCDAIYDGQRGITTMTRDEIELAWYHGHAESLVMLRQKGLV